MPPLDRLDRRPLHPSEVASVASAAQRGDQAAQLRMVGAVYSLILRECHRSLRFNPGSELEDLVQEACMGLIRHAIPRFDPTRAKWITYAAWWIRAAIWREVDRDRAMPLPAQAIDEARQAGTSRELRLLASPTSLDEEIPGTDQKTLHDVLHDPGDSLEERAEQIEATARIVAAAVELPPKEAYTVLLRLVGRTLHQVGERFGTSREYVRQLEQRAHKALGELVPDQGSVRLAACPGWRRTCGEVPEVEVGLCLPCFRALEQAAGAQAVELGPVKPRRACSVEGCEGRHAAKGLCSYHYERQRVRNRSRSA